MTAPGLLLSNRYRLARRIAVGGMGEVWSADDIRLARLVALKILRPEFTGDLEFVERFRTEARITASLNHPGICAVYDYGEVTGGAGGPYLTGTAYLVMELITGESLSSVLARTGRLSPTRTLDVLAQTGAALQQAHARSLVHRDIKPGNLLITPLGQVKITDFGIAKVAHQAPITRLGMVMGTAQYISPEQAGGKDASPASDIYSLGVVAYECLAGRLPFRNDNTVAIALAHVREAPPPLPDDVPPAVARLVMDMLVKDPARRFPNGAALAQAVGVVRQDGAFGAGPPSSGRAPAPTRVVAAGGPAAAGSGPAPRTADGSMRRSPHAVPSTPAPTRIAPVQALPRPAQALPPAARPSYGPPIATADMSRRAAGTAAPTPRPAGRRTGLSILIAVLVLVLAGLALLLVNTLAGQLAAAPGGVTPGSGASLGTGVVGHGGS